MSSSSRKKRKDIPMPRRPPNTAVRQREHLELSEVNLLMETAKYSGRNRERDYALLLVMYRHGLRAAEACNLQWGAVSFDAATIAINRLKGSESGVHPLQDDELEALEAVRHYYPGETYIFPKEKGGKLKTVAITRILQRVAREADLESLKIHPHMLRHSCGYFLANEGHDTRLIQDWLGHKNIQHTVRYTKLNPGRFNSIKWS